VEQQENKRLYIGNLPWKLRREDLEALFAQAGTVVDAYIVIDKMKHRSKGYGFVEMSSIEEATAAIEKFNGYELEGRALVVNFARPKEDHGETPAVPTEETPVATEEVATEQVITEEASTEEVA